MEWIFTQMDVPTTLMGQPWHIVFERPAQTWLWLVGAIVLVSTALFSYINIRGSRGARIFLFSLRVITLSIISILAMEPIIEWPREKTEQDFVQVLVDRSSSLQVRDMLDGQNKITSRVEFQNEILQHGVWDRLAQDHKLEWVSVTGNATLVSNKQALPEARGNRTLLASALRETLQRNLGRPLSAVVIISDGRSQDAINATTLRQMQALGVPVFTIPLGDPNGVNDQAILSVEAPQSGFLQDQIPVQANLNSRNPNKKIRVVLKDKESQRKIDEQEAVSGPDGKASVTLVGQGFKSGETVWEVAILGEPDADQSNDSQRVDIKFVDRPIHVLYLDGWPRWEFRYIKNILLREKGIESSIMLLSADRDFAQEGTTPLTRLPRTENEFSVYDVIILGDVPAGFLNRAQQKNIQDLVAKRGNGLLWIAGDRSTPSSWRGSPLEELLPFRGLLDLPRVDRPVYMEPTEAAARIGLLRLGNTQDNEQSWPVELSASGESWARLEWAQRIDVRDLKPTTEILANAVAQTESAEKSNEPNKGTPLVLTMRYGAGQTTYVATDETWRWRFGRGEKLPERFWIQLIRHLARAGLRNKTGISLQVDPPQATANQPIRIVVDLDEAPVNGVVVVEAFRPISGGSVDIALQSEGNNRFSSVWIAPNESDGIWRFRIRLPQILETPEATLTVIQEDTERLDATPDHEALQKLSAATKGQMVATTNIQSLETLIPRRSFTTRQPIQMPLWNKWIIYVVLITTLTTEWVGRRIMKLM